MENRATSSNKTDKSEYTFEREFNRDSLVMSALKYKSVHDLIRDRVKSANKLVAEYEKSEEFQKQRNQLTTIIKPHYTPYPYAPSLYDELLYKWRSPAGFFDDFHRHYRDTSPKTYDDAEDEEDEVDEKSFLSADLPEHLIERMRELEETIEMSCNTDAEYETSTQLPIGLDKIKEEEKGPFFDEIITFLKPILKNRWAVYDGIDGAVDKVKKFVEEHQEDKNNLLQLMNVKRLMIPYCSLDITVRAILCYNQLEEDDPLVPVFRTHPIIGEEIKKLGVFLDRFDTHKEVICSLIWSNVDNTLVSLPVVGLTPYPMCFTCRKAFGEKTCAKCGVFKYCSKKCQVQGWKMHQYSCIEIQKIVSQFKVLVFE